jgi:hypothetical protein
MARMVSATKHPQDFVLPAINAAPRAVISTPQEHWHNQCARPLASVWE